MCVKCPLGAPEPLGRGGQTGLGSQGPTHRLKHGVGGEAAGEALEQQVVTRSPSRQGGRPWWVASQPAAVQEAWFRARLNSNL